jgi:aminoglycoside phosphotransferase family enzyme/predicted kinase
MNGVEAVETHISVLFSVGDRVYKLKKPVNLGFVDFTERTVRRKTCQQEVALNSRFAPDVYLGVADVIGPDGELCDHLVVMRRMPSDRRLSTLVIDGEDVDDALRDVARRLAVVHAAAKPTAEMCSTSSVEAVRARWAESCEQLRNSGARCIDGSLAASVEHLALRYLRGRGPLFDSRIADGCIRDGHGDLRADDIFCLDDGPRILDCIEFDERLRWGDVVSDAAFLAMDLERLGRPELGRRFLDRYREFSAGRWPQSLEHHYIAYRAHVRAKVDCLRFEQDQDEAAARSAGHHLQIARDHLWQGRVQLVLVGGLPGTGKSTVANGIADAGAGIVVSTDEIRKDLAGVSRTTAAAAEFGEGLYRPEVVDRTYDEVLARAQRLLSLGETVILDASFTSARHRDAARRMAAEADADMLELRCVCPPDLAEQRLVARPPGTSASDATPAVARRLAARQDPWPEALDLRTDRPAEEAVREATKRLHTPDL